MKPFNVSPLFKDFIDTYPKAEGIKSIIQQESELSSKVIARMWISEGIPFAFRNSPILYDGIRLWLSNKIKVDPKDINLTGSARIGESLAPKKLGKPFDDKSDLDIFIVSSNLFEKMKKDFYTWQNDFNNKQIEPKSDYERRCWNDNLQIVEKTIKRGFIDSNYIPKHKQYTCISNIGNSMWCLVEKLRITDNAPKVKKASIRCYNSWENCINQISLNLKTMKNEPL